MKLIRVYAVDYLIQSDDYVIDLYAHNRPTREPSSQRVLTTWFSFIKSINLSTEFRFLSGSMDLKSIYSSLSFCLPTETCLFCHTILPVFRKYFN